MRNEIVVNKFAAACPDHIGRARLAAWRAVIEVGAHDGNDWNLFSCFRVGGQPVGKMDFCIVGASVPCSGRVDIDEGFLNWHGLVGAVLENPSIASGPVPLKGVAIPDGGIHRCLIVFGGVGRATQAP